MKKLFFFLMLGIAFASCDGLDPINPNEVVKCNIFATYDSNVTISPASVVINQGQSVVLDVITKAGYTSTVKVNGTVVHLTSSKLTLSNVVADMKVEATSKKIKQYTITATIDSNGTINPAVTVVDSGKVVLNLWANPNFGYVIDKFKVNGEDKSYTPSCYDFGNVTSDTKVEVTTKEAPIDPYFFGIKWRLDSVYSRVPGLAGYEEYSLYLYAYHGKQVSYFFSSGDFAENWDGKFLGGSIKWSVDTSTNPNILSSGYGHANDRKVEVRTSKKLVLSHFTVFYNADGSKETDEFKETYIPEP